MRISPTFMESHMKFDIGSSKNLAHSVRVYVVLDQNYVNGINGVGNTKVLLPDIKPANVFSDYISDK